MLNFHLHHFGHNAVRLKPLLNLVGDRLYSLPMLVLYLTDGCNSKCATCDIWKNPRRNMPMQLVRELVDTAAEIGTRWVLFSGGEAMQHPQWAEIARLFKEKNIRVMLLTNGLLVRKQAKDIGETIDDLFVSLDGGNAATYEAIRGVDAFDLILQGICEVAKQGIPVSTRTTVQRANFREIPQITDVALAAGASQVSFLAMDTSNPYAFGERNLNLQDDWTQEEDRELETVLDDFTVSHAQAFTDGKIAESPAKLRRILLDYVSGKETFAAPRCNAPHFSTVVEVDGTVRPCYFLPSYGRLKPQGEKLTDVVNTSAAQQLRHAYRTGQRAECARCVCPLYRGARSLVTM